jgi:hypothetical protein
MRLPLSSKAGRLAIGELPYELPALSALPTRFNPWRIVQFTIIQCMSSVGNKLKGLTPLPAPVPPMLAKAIGYSGDARYVKHG